MKIFRASSLPIQRQAAMTAGTLICVLTFAIAALARTDDAPPGTAGTGWAALVTPQNIVTVVVLVYGAGMLREQFNDVKRRLEKLEAVIEVTIPETYVRKDVLEGPPHGGIHIGRS